MNYCCVIVVGIESKTGKRHRVVVERILYDCSGGSKEVGELLIFRTIKLPTSVCVSVQTKQTLKPP